MAKSAARKRRGAESTVSPLSPNAPGAPGSSFLPLTAVSATTRERPPARTTLRVRMYRQGLGDCFLLTFPRTEGGDYHVLIDCGVILGTPNADSLMREIVADLAEATSRRIDLVVATHEHWDHISGFHPDLGLFQDFIFSEVWLAWTEDPDDRTAAQLRAERAERLQALWLGIEGMTKNLRGAATSSEAADVVHRSSAVLGFFGIDPEQDKAPSLRAGLGAAGAPPPETRTARALRWLRMEKTSNVQFRRPGEEFELPDATGVRVYVLGPPIDLRLLRKDLPTRSDNEIYELAGTRLAATEAAFFAGMTGDAGTVEFDGSLPFDAKYRVEEADAQKIEFFRDHYFGAGENDADATLRRIDNEWMQGASALALQLDSDTNNTSLALAFELPDGAVLLFPGDAQVGNWESWHIEKEGVHRVWEVNGRKVTAEGLLRRTILYKVGHHGSHNATLREKGLEMMSDPNLTALVPVDQFVAHSLKNWQKMPFKPLLTRLHQRSEGRLVLADTPLPSDADTPKPGRTRRAPHSEEPRLPFAKALFRAKDAEKVFSTPFRVTQDDGQTTVESRRPLYVDLEMDWPRG